MSQLALGNHAGPRALSGTRQSSGAAFEEFEQPAEAPLAQKLVMAALVAAPLMGCAAAIVILFQAGWMGWLHIGLLLGGWLVTGLGITVGFHRLLAHRAFETYGWVRNFWATLGALALEGSPVIWCAVHRKHHSRSDKPGDPHSPHLHDKGWRGVVRGLVHAHVGWLFTGYYSQRDLRRYAPDLLKDRYLDAIDRNYAWFVILSLAIPAMIGGLATLSLGGAVLGLIWGGLVRMFVVHHTTWSVNSICHLFGSKDYESGDTSRNNLIFGLLAHGEGWHNNHHAFPTSARHGLSWWQIDLSWLVIRLMGLLGLAWNVRTPNAAAVAAKRL